MKSTTVLLAVLVSCCCCLATVAADKYQQQYDAVSIESVLSNDRVLTNYIKCLLDKGACTKEGRELKRLLPDAIQTDCSKCTDVQKRNSRKVITFLRTRRPQDWKKLTDKYDPTGLYNKRTE